MDKQEENILAQVENYFKNNNYDLLLKEERFETIQFLAKDKKTGKNESFLILNNILYMFVNTGRQKEPWRWVSVLKLTEEMTAKNL